MALLFEFKGYSVRIKKSENQRCGIFERWPAKIESEKGSFFGKGAESGF